MTYSVCLYRFLETLPGARCQLIAEHQCLNQTDTSLSSPGLDAEAFVHLPGPSFDRVVRSGYRTA